MLISKYSAIDSWEGYTYQGQVGIFVALRELNELLLKGTNIDDYNFSLEIEGAEDFSIKYGNEYLSLHQVKLGAISLDQNGKKDKFSFIVSLLQHKVRRGYYHISSNRHLPQDFVQKTKSDIRLLLLDFAQKVVRTSDISEADFPSYIVIEKINPISKKCGKYDLLKFALQHKGINEYTIENVSLAIDDIRLKLEMYLTLLLQEDISCNDDNFISIYNNRFNNANEVRIATCEIIKDILKREKDGYELPSYIDDKYIGFLCDKLFILLHNKITETFINKDETKNICDITFSMIKEVLIEDYHSNMNSVDYQYFLVKNSMRKSLENFLAINDGICTVSSCGECGDINICNLQNQMNAINALDDEKTRDFIKKLILHTPQIGKPHNLPYNVPIKLYKEFKNEVTSDIIKPKDGVKHEKTQLQPRIQSQNRTRNIARRAPYQ